MKARHRQESVPTVKEAIATLSSIAEFDFDGLTNSIESEVEDLQDPSLIKRVKRLEDSIEYNRVKEIFSVILSYLKQFYKNERGYLTDPQTLEGIKRIMLLVSDAAKKIDRYSLINKKGQKASVTQLKEYRQLNEFYRERIAHQIDEAVLGKWLLGLSQESMERQRKLQDKGESLNATQVEESPKHLFVNLDGVKKDSDYELFYIRKEDGTHFYSPRLLRNIKLICDFSSREQSKDPLIDIKIWIDEQFHHAAKDILNSLHELIEHFYHDSTRYKHRDLVAYMNKCFMSLFLCKNPLNRMRQLPSAAEEPRKNCQSYFSDFLIFLREALHSEEYHKLIAYPEENNQNLNALLLEVVHSLCRAVYFSLRRFHDFNSHLDHIIESSYGLSKGHKQNKNFSLSDQLKQEYESMSKLLNSHSRGPLGKLLDSLLAENISNFDPFTQMNIPSRLFGVVIGNQKIVNIHLPSPTSQEYIHRVNVIDEFKGALRSYSTEYPFAKHLLINLQDRTSWREHFRAAALEELRTNEDLRRGLSVVTLAKDTDFYYQLSPYDKDNHTEVFLNQFKEHIGDESCGYYFPSMIKNPILGDFVDGVLRGIHRIFFSNKNTLTQVDRLAFIEIFHIFLTLKFIDLVNPNTFSLTCKDGLDVAACSSSLLFIFMKMIGKEPLCEKTMKDLNRILYSPALLVRERLVAKDRFERMLGALKVLELSYRDLGHEVFGRVIHDAFEIYYKAPIFDRSFVIMESA